MNEKIQKEIFSYSQQHYVEAVELLKQLASIPAPSHHEDARAEFVCTWLKNHGAQHVHIDSAKNTICEIGTESHKGLIVFQAHMDIVFPDTSSLSVSEKNGYLYAPGIGDDTANLVNLLIATEYLLLKKPKLNCGFLIAANSCEEGLGNLAGTREIFRMYGNRIQRFYSFDGYLSTCTKEAVGSDRWRLSVSAKGGHSWADYGNPNAIEALAEMIVSMKKIPLPADSKTTFNIGRIEGGTTVNSIAQHASMLFEYRSARQENLAYMKKNIIKVLDPFLKDPELNVHLELLGTRPGTGPVNPAELASFTSENLDIISAFYKGAISCEPNSTDANIPLSLGISANTIGTVRGGGAHTREEWMDPESMKTGIAIVLGCLMKYTAAE